MQQQFARRLLADFRIEMMADYPDQAKHDVKMLMPFSTTYPCETSLSILRSIKNKLSQSFIHSFIKNKYCEMLNAEHDMTLKLSQFLADI